MAEVTLFLLSFYVMQLPLPYLKVGYLIAPPENSAIAPHKEWERSQFVLNHEELQQVVLPLFFVHLL
jgi:hypothetical protein